MCLSGILYEEELLIFERFEVSPVYEETDNQLPCVVQNKCKFHMSVLNTKCETEPNVYRVNPFGVYLVLPLSELTERLSETLR